MVHWGSVLNCLKLTGLWMFVYPSVVVDVCVCVCVLPFFSTEGRGLGCGGEGGGLNITDKRAARHTPA